MFLNILFFSCVCLFVPGVYVIKIIIILPHLNYCILSWGHYCEPITLLQKRAMRTVCYTKYNAHIEPLFIMCNVLKFNDLYDIVDILS